MRNKKLNSTVASRVEAILSGLLHGLCRNRSVRECHLLGGLVNLSELAFFRNSFWPSLVELLRDGNAALESVTAPTVDQIHDMSCKEVQEAYHLMTLNRFGRRVARQPGVTIADLVRIINQVNATEDGTVDKMSTIFGLLRDCPVVGIRAIELSKSE